ncbi:type II toxin-antitoxin system PemK/MazF family toxin [Deinococcus radiotolerans]|uniref:mRNA interferase n=1 Tax=Deinococcus radiotolerans TaxID=1309407 RepID=A0ABQ2FRQ5_9DEIO|nr:type II toxin-antitoxin system PemK/MazF family toxin [Deinococcus radiotolerans]GGL19953.1 hypothetical protein GCM10010844_43570 [Deinococcus radiotolerans]
MRQGDFYLADLDPIWPSGADRRHPVVIVISDAVNRAVDRSGAKSVAGVPVTWNIAWISNIQVLLPADQRGLAQDSKVQAEQIRPISFSRLSPAPVGILPPALMREPNDALRLHLSLT